MLIFWTKILPVSIFFVILSFAFIIRQGHCFFSNKQVSSDFSCVFFLSSFNCIHMNISLATAAGQNPDCAARYGGTSLLPRIAFTACTSSTYLPGLEVLLVVAGGGVWHTKKK